ncbi:hypothetical protein F7725_029058 [Dissostichus mawsoni]|uniref:Palmitoyl-protein thioesterase ABHD10, mitochondrial n=1 Tax=Dissostichus mawsoni TaxID=36200 RepID=A0A7J5XHQ7_DISMA|nr:hypothetical protein F7725_029058 [Dissostichus mawsoni]
MTGEWESTEARDGPFHSPLPPAMQSLDWNTPAGTEDISQPLNSISSLTTASVSPHIIAAAQESSYKLGRLTLIAPESCGSTTSASHPAIIVSVGVGGLEKKEGFAAYGKALYCVSGAEDVWMKPDVVASSSGLTVKEAILPIVVKPFVTSALKRHFLSVPGVSHRLVVIVLQPDVSQLVVGHVFDERPLHLELALPLVLRPDARVGIVVHRGAHLGHAAEVPAAVDAEQQVQGALVAQRAVGTVQTLVAMFCAAPDGVLDGAVDVVFRIALDNENAPVFQAPVKVFGVVVVEGAQLLQHGVHLTGAGGGTQGDSPNHTEALTTVPGSHPAVGGWTGLLGLLLMEGLWGARLRGEVHPLSSQVPMFILCFMGGGGMAPPPIPMLALGLTFGCGLAGFLAMAAQEAGFGAEELTGGGRLLAAMLLIPAVPSGEPTVLVTAATMSVPSFKPHRDFTQLGVASKARLSVRDGPTQRAGGVTVAVTVDRALGGLALRDTGSPGGKVCITREEVEAMLAQEGGGVPQGTGLAKHTVREEVRLAIAHLSIGGQWVAEQYGSRRAEVLPQRTFTDFKSPETQVHSPVCLRPDLPKLAYRRVKGKSPGVLFLPGYASNMNGQKAEALEEFCRSLGHSYLRFDYTGHGASEGVLSEGTIGTWKKDVLYVLDELVEGPQIMVGSSLGGWLMLLAAIARPEKTAALVGISTAADHIVTVYNSLSLEARKEFEEKGEWTLPTKHPEEGLYDFNMDFLKEAENHCVLQSPIPITCPVRLIHGLKDEDVPWHISMQVAERILSADVDVILRRQGQHRMSERDDIKLMVYTIDDLIDKLTTMV